MPLNIDEHQAGEWKLLERKLPRQAAKILHTHDKSLVTDANKNVTDSTSACRRSQGITVHKCRLYGYSNYMVDKHVY